MIQSFIYTHLFVCTIHIDFHLFGERAYVTGRAISFSFLSFDILLEFKIFNYQQKQFISNFSVTNYFKVVTQKETYCLKCILILIMH